MRIKTIHVQDFLGVEAAQLSLAAPVALIAGANGAGKSSIRDAVALALTADLGRVSLKKEAGQLVRSGAAFARCGVTDADGDEFAVTVKAGGQISDSQKGRETPPALPYVLDAQRLARMADDERRSFLFGLMGVATDAQEVSHRLLARNADRARVERILPLLRSGFEAAEAEARRRTTEARGAWKATTGEAYGREKARGWRAQAPDVDAARMKALGTELEHADVAVGQWREQVGKLQAEERRRAELRARLPALQEHAGRIQRLQEKLAADDASMLGAQEALARAVEAAGAGPRVGLVHDLARGLYHMLLADMSPGASPEWREARNALDAYVNEFGPVIRKDGDPDAAASLPALRQQVDLMTRAFANARRDLEAAQAAQAQAKAIEDELAEVFDVAGLAEARSQIETLQARRAEIDRELAALRRAKDAADAAKARTEKAAGHAEDVLAWELIAEQLAPSGIPGDLLSEALGPITERLRQHAADTGWPEVAIAADMSITGGGRAYRLLSESERWRVDAMLAEAVAHLSGVRLLVLDRMDVLDLPGRSELLGWLDTLAELGEIDTALVFGTLKARPTQLPAHIEAHWIERGYVAELDLAQAA